MRLTAVLCGVLLGFAPGCGTAGPPGDPGDPGLPGDPGIDGAGCTVVDNGDGTKTVTCGTDTIIVSDGTPGLAGDDCTVVDNMDGTADITCGMTTVTVRLPDGPPGSDTYVPDPRVNYGAVHDPACVGSYDSDCVACHGDQLTEGSLDTTIPGFHQMKLALPDIPGATDNEKCVYCHVEVDLSNNQSAASLRRQVDVNLCAVCHSSGTYQFYQP